ncbi:MULTISPECIES: helix-turn-helix domain-containing protein [unclassified Corynebacterium]|uniref:helix-turn-helix domain-containing protein n=1 Tax=unclassified Corynebacterium TaxID=2624378 RepID=UPI0035244B36
MVVSYPHPALLWCHSGSATISVGAWECELPAGELCYAAGPSTVSGDGLVIPIVFPNLGISGPSRRVHLGVDWGDFMVYEFSRSLGYLRGTRTLSPEISRLFDDPAAPPPAPEAEEANAVAQRLRINPGDQTSLEEFAEQYRVSARTLQRQFLASTGLTFSEWRTAYRVSSAAELLARDFSVAVAANLVGFAATSSLTRAFRRHTGCTPSAYTPGSVGMAPAGTPPQIPSSSTWHRSTGSDVVLWVYRGTATLTTPGYCRFLGNGDSATIPAGTNTRLDIAAGSIALPMSAADDLDEAPRLEDVVDYYRSALGVVTRSDTASAPSVFTFTQKMDEARQLLRAGLRPKDVSRTVGYRSTAAFSRAFKGMHGISPRDFQNEQFAEIAVRSASQ